MTKFTVSELNFLYFIKNGMTSGIQETPTPCSIEKPVVLSELGEGGEHDDGHPSTGHIESEGVGLQTMGQVHTEDAGHQGSGT